MMIMRNRAIILMALSLVAILLPFGLSAQDARLSESWQNNRRHGIAIDFRVNSYTIERDYHENEDALNRIDSLLSVFERDTLRQIVHIEFYGTASPEGGSAVNDMLSRRRMESLEEYVRERHDFADSLVGHNDHYIAWDHLEELVAADEEFAAREEVLEILRTEYPEAVDHRGQPIDGRISHLQALNGGQVWRTMLNRYFRHMRNAWMIIISTREYPNEPSRLAIIQPEQIIEPVPMPLPATRPVEPEPEPAPVEERTPLMNIKINALEAAGLVSNIGMEFRITPRLSFDVMGHYSPYDYFNDARKVRVFAIQPEVRYWFGESLVRGHFVGLHVPVAGFNIQLNDKYRYQDPNHALWGIGLSYGYAMPLGKRERWGVEFTIGLGYMDIKYDVYEGVHNGRYLRTETVNYFGPTRLGINFTYRIDLRNKNRD